MIPAFKRLARAVAPAALLLPALLFLSAVSALAGGPDPLPEPPTRNLFFLHHSTGRYLLEQGAVRDSLAARGEADSVVYELWDHDYNQYGLKDAGGDDCGWSYGIPGDNTDPDGLHVLWTTANAARDSILANHRVIAFKSCYPASDIGSDAQLETRKQWYREMRDFFDTQTGHIFVVMSQPPRHPDQTDLAAADRARAFAEWLGSGEYLDGHPNLVCFDFFDALAHPDDGSGERNTLRAEYRRDGAVDSHPNETANREVAPLFVDALARAAGLLEEDDSPPPPPGVSWGSVKSLFSE